MLRPQCALQPSWHLYSEDWKKGFLPRDLNCSLGGLECIVQAFAGKSLGVSERVGSGQVKQAEVRGRGPEAHPRPPSPREGLRDVALCSAGGRELATCPLTSSLLSDEELGSGGRPNQMQRLADCPGPSTGLSSS